MTFSSSFGSHHQPNPQVPYIPLIALLRHIMMQRYQITLSGINPFGSESMSEDSDPQLLFGSLDSKLGPLSREQVDTSEADSEYGEETETRKAAYSIDHMVVGMYALLKNRR